MHVTLTELRYLVALDKERHFGRAAKRVFVSQPTLSVAVKKLEEKLEITIFERNRGEAWVTPIGRRIIDQAHRVLDEVEVLESTARYGRDELNGPLRLGVIYSIGPNLLPHLVPRLCKSAPDMPLMIEEGFIRGLVQQLRNNELDVIIIAMPCDTSGLEVWPIYDESYVVVMPRNHPWAEQQVINPRSLASEDLLLLGPGHSSREQVLNLLEEFRTVEGAARVHTGSSIETIRHMVASGLGITVLPSSSIPDLPVEPRLLEARPFAGEPLQRRVVIAWRKGFPRPKAIKALHGAVMQYGPPGVRLLSDSPAVASGA